MAAQHISALDYFMQGDWQQAHHLIQHYDDPLSCQIHGYLHWQQGDLSNARYWYDRAHQIVPNSSPKQEFERLYQLASQPQ